MEVRKYFGHTCPELSAKWDLAITGLAPSLLQELAGRTGARPPLSSCGVRTNASEFSASYGCAHQSNPPTLSPGIGTWRKVRSRGPCRVRNRSHPPPPPRCISGKNVCEPSFSFSLRVTDRVHYGSLCAHTRASKATCLAQVLRFASFAVTTVVVGRPVPQDRKKSYAAAGAPCCARFRRERRAPFRGLA